MRKHSILNRQHVVEVLRPAFQMGALFLVDCGSRLSAKFLGALDKLAVNGGSVLRRLLGRSPS
ncbi:MAG TPA: hypothetical protein VIX63_12970 [Vicinamibacterales bacterium]